MRTPDRTHKGPKKPPSNGVIRLTMTRTGPLKNAVCRCPHCNTMNRIATGQETAATRCGKCGRLMSNANADRIVIGLAGGAITGATFAGVPGAAVGAVVGLWAAMKART